MSFASRLVSLLSVLLLTAPGLAQTLAPEGPTLAAIRARGHLVCGAADPIRSFAHVNTEGRWVGFDVDVCRAIAAAVFGKPDALEFRPLSGTARFADLQTGELDVVVRDAPWTLSRDTRYNVRYTAPTFYDGQAFMVAETLNVVSAYQLDNVSVCVLDGDQLGRLQEFAFVTQANFTEIVYEDREDLNVAYQKGLCEAVSAPGSWLNALRREAPDPSTQRILPERISSSVFGPVVRADDEQWYKIVQWTVFALINAEEAGVTSLNIESLSAAKTHRIRRLLGLEGSFGPSIGLSPSFMKNVIAAVGNYGEMFDRNFGAGTGAGVPRGQNALYLNGGLIYAPNIE